MILSLFRRFYEWCFRIDWEIAHPLDEAVPVTPCTCGAEAVALVAVPGLLCDEPGMTRTYTFCDPCGRLLLDHYRGAELIAPLDRQQRAR